MQIAVALTMGFILDLHLGDPAWLYHPVRAIGWLIARLEGIFRRLFPKTERGEFWAGALMASLVALISSFLPLLALVLLELVHPVLSLLLEAFFCYQLLATKSLRDESMKVYEKLLAKDLPGARKAVSMIVGRDTGRLTDLQVAKAAVETIAENASDGVIAPLFFLAIGGAPLGFFYKAVNTMDSMVGYRNERYLWFGRFAARLDDVLNFIPARLSAFLMIAAAFLLRLDYRNAVKIYRRDRKNHKSPNSAQTESVCAGALDILLAGDAYYFGTLHQKPTIGDDVRPVCYGDIKTANRLMVLTAFLGLALLVGVRLLLIF